MDSQLLGVVIGACAGLGGSVLATRSSARLARKNSLEQERRALYAEVFEHSARILTLLDRVVRDRDVLTLPLGDPTPVAEPDFHPLIARMIFILSDDFSDHFLQWLSWRRRLLTATTWNAVEQATDSITRQHIDMQEIARADVNPRRRSLRELPGWFIRRPFIFRHGPDWLRILAFGRVTYVPDPLRPSPLGSKPIYGGKRRPPTEAKSPEMPD